jgi:prevent-host-death family protein
MEPVLLTLGWKEVPRYGVISQGGIDQGCMILLASADKLASWATAVAFDHGHRSWSNGSMDTMPISKFKAECLAVMAEVKRTGRPILVTKRGEPVVEVIPARAKEKKRKLGCMAGTFEIVGDIVGPVIDLNEINAYRDPDSVLDPRGASRRRRKR